MSAVLKFICHDRSQNTGIHIRHQRLSKRLQLMLSLSRAAAGQTYIQSLKGGRSQITLLSQEKVFSKAIFSSRDFVEEYSFLPEIVDCGVAQGQQKRVDILFA